MDAAGHNALPVRSTGSAWELIRNHRLFVDVVVIDPAIPNASSFLADLRLYSPALKVVTAISEQNDNSFVVPESEVARRKPLLFCEEAALQWINLIQMLSDPFRQRRSQH